MMPAPASVDVTAIQARMPGASERNPCLGEKQETPTLTTGPGAITAFLSCCRELG